MDETNALLREILQELKKLTAKREATRAKRAACNAGRFPEFWDAYPRAKAGKLAAEKAYEKAIGVDTHDAIMAGVERFARELKKSPRDTNLIPHASTWLNAGRWMDEDEDKPKVTTAPDPQAYSDPVEKEKENQRKLADEWTDKKLAELSQDEIIAIKREIMVKWPEAIKLKPSLGINFLRAEVRKRHSCPYSR
jgi:hypothetical protein